MNNQPSPLISVIIPCYNYELYLGVCLDSLIAQTYQHWECIIIDDGSTDNSVAIAQQYSTKDPRFTYVIQKNAGPTVARNVGLKKSKGHFIQFLDADDLLQAHKFEKQLNIFALNSLLDIVYSQALYFSTTQPDVFHHHLDLQSPSELKAISGKGDVVVTELLKGNMMVISAPLIKKEVFDNYGYFDEAFYYNEDWELWTRFALANCSFLADNTANTKPLIRVHQSYSKNNFNMFVNGLMVCLKLKTTLRLRKYKKIMFPKIAYHQRMIDAALLEYLKTDKKMGIEKTQWVYQKTHLLRYKIYTTWFTILPVFMCKALSFAVCSLLKIKNSIVYA